MCFGSLITYAQLSQTLTGRVIDTDTRDIPKMKSIFKGRAEDLNKEKIT